MTINNKNYTVMKKNTLLLFVLVFSGIAGCDKATNAEPERPSSLRSI
jgi:hypothetical protein